MSILFKPQSSGSTTITLNPTAPAQVMVQLKQGIKGKVIELLQLMDNPSLFSPSAFEIMQQWQRESLEIYFNDLSSDEAKKEASKVLSYLLIDVIRPAMLTEKNPDILEQICDIEEEFFAILRQTLPSNIDEEKFIQEREANHRKIQTFLKKMALEDACTGEATKHLHSAAQAINQDNIDTFSSLKEGLSTLHAKRDAQLKSVEGALDAADQKVHQTTKVLLNNLDTAKTTGKEMQATFQGVAQARQDILQNANRVKKL
jgi:hypothetical protein